MFERSRSLQIYVKPGIKEDDLLISVWEAAKKLDRPQDVFRSMLRAGLHAMLESGEMPESIIDECDLDLILEKRMRRKVRKSGEQMPHPATQTYHAPLPIPTPWPHPGNHTMPPAPHPSHVYSAPPPDVQEAKPEVANEHASVEVERQQENIPTSSVRDNPRQTADSDNAKPSQSGISRVNRMKNLM